MSVLQIQSRHHFPSFLAGEFHDLPPTYEQVSQTSQEIERTNTERVERVERVEQVENNNNNNSLGTQELI